MKTFSLKAKQHTPNWVLIDASGQTLGRLASNVAMRLMGKDKAHYTPHMVSGDVVIVINASKVKVTGNKMQSKIYYRHTGYPGGIKEINLKDKLEKDPTSVIQHAVEGMLPKNKLANLMLKNLKVFPGPEHSFNAQKPTEVEVKG